MKRTVVLLIAVAALLFVDIASAANTYEDLRDRFVIDLPEGWQIQPQTNDRVYVFKRDNDSIILEYVPNTNDPGELLKKALTTLKLSGLNNPAPEGDVKSLTVNGNPARWGVYKSEMDIGNIRVALFGLLGCVSLKEHGVYFMSILNQNNKAVLSEPLEKAFQSIRSPGQALTRASDLKAVPVETAAESPKTLEHESVFGTAIAEFSMTINPSKAKPAEVSINKEILPKINTVAVVGFKNSPKNDCGMLPPQCPAPQALCSYPYANDGSVIADRVAKQIMKSFAFKVIDREQIENILKEQAFQLSGAIDSKAAVDIGKIIGADAVIFGKVNSCLYGLHYYCKGKQLSQPIGIVNISLKMVSIETAEFIMLADLELTAYNLLDQPVKMEYDKVINNPMYYVEKIPALDAVISEVVKAVATPLITSKKDAR